MKLQELARELSQLKSAKDKIEDELSAINKRIEILARQEIPEAMDEAGVQNVKFEGIGKIYLKGDVFASIPAESRDAAYEWLELTGRGSLIKPTVNSSSLKAAVKEWLTQGEEIPEELIRVTPYTQAVLTRS